MGYVGIMQYPFGVFSIKNANFWAKWPVDKFGDEIIFMNY
jgi:hypothetical protein